MDEKNWIEVMDEIIEKQEQAPLPAQTYPVDHQTIRTRVGAQRLHAHSADPAFSRSKRASANATEQAEPDRRRNNEVFAGGTALQRRRERNARRARRSAFRLSHAEFLDGSNAASAEHGKLAASRAPVLLDGVRRPALSKKSAGGPLAATQQNQTTLLDMFRGNCDGSSCDKTTTAEGECQSPAASTSEQMPVAALGDYDGERPYELGRRPSCIYNDGDRAGARRSVTVVDYIWLAEGPGVHVREEDGFEREGSEYYLHKIEDVRFLEVASGSTETHVESAADDAADSNVERAGDAQHYCNYSSFAPAHREALNKMTKKEMGKFVEARGISALDGSTIKWERQNKRDCVCDIVAGFLVLQMNAYQGQLDPHMPVDEWNRLSAQNSAELLLEYTSMGAEEVA